MNAREKILAGIVGGLVGVAALGLGVHAIVVKPLREEDRKTALLRDKLNKLKAERRAFFAAEEQVKAFTARTFSDDLDQASARSAAMLTRQILRAGLRESDFSRLPAGPRKLRGAQEIGWSIQGDGPLVQIVNLLFLLDAEPHLNRIEGLTVTPAEKPGIVRARFRYLTLVADPGPADMTFTNLVEALTLDSPERRLLDGIVARDILRPYLKRPADPARPGAPSVGNVNPPIAAALPEKLKIVSLSEWQGQPEVHVRDQISQRITVHKAGDSLAGGTIVMVDYRPLPLPGKELLQSFARVIVKQGTDYWAIERGSTLDQKYKLAPEQLPAQLAPADEASPAAAQQ